MHTETDVQRNDQAVRRSLSFTRLARLFITIP